MPTPTLIIYPPRKWVPIDFQEIWKFRNLLYNFILRDIKIRYKQTVFGFLWVILQPVIMMIIFSIIFGRFANIPSDGIPYPIFSFVALIPWILFSDGLSRSSTGMVTNAGVITKVYFPRLIIPISGVLSPLIDFFIASVILIIMMTYYRIVPTIGIIFIPFFILLAVVIAFAIGLWISALNVKYRDFQYTLPFLIQLGLYASPIVYPISMIPEQYRLIYGLNPMVGVIEGFRWALLGAKLPTIEIFTSIIIVIIILIGGLFYFKKMEQYFADVI
jgi:lipopolysaccharide transport system permease protein